MHTVQDVTHTRAEMHVSRPDHDTLLVQLSGDWHLQRTLPSVAEVQRAMGHRNINSTVAYLSFREEDIADAILAA
jgi:hypothetical protein